MSCPDRSVRDPRSCRTFTRKETVMSKTRSRKAPKKRKAGPPSDKGPDLKLDSFQGPEGATSHPIDSPERAVEGLSKEEAMANGRTGTEVNLGLASSNIKLMERTVPLKTQKGLIASIRSPERISYEIKARDISCDEVGPFLDNLFDILEEKGSLGIYFHNDMDGLNGALLVRSMISQRLPGLEVQAYPIEYSELPKISLSDEMVYIFIDIETSSERPNVFRIDHHHSERDMKIVLPNLFLLSPPEDDYIYPSTSAGLCAYLGYVCSGGTMTYLQYLALGPWHDDPLTRALLLLASVCDNLWHLNFVTDIPIKRWIPNLEEERNLILISISASLLLGSDVTRRELIDKYFNAEPTLEDYMAPLMSQLKGARNVLSFCETVSREIDGFYNRVFFSITDSIGRSASALERDTEMLRKLNDSMPLDMRGNRDKMMALLKTKGDLNDKHWKRIEFYGKQLEKLESRVKVEEKRLEKLREAKHRFDVDKGPRLCVSIPRQISRQVKGIISSLLYYKGWKNVTLEDRGLESFWGSRGFPEDVIMEQFTTLSLGYEDLKDYLALEKVFKDLPEVFKRTLNISRNISMSKSYSGGMGGRGSVFGGVMRGKVPWVFSLLEETGDLETKIKELMVHKELGSALQGLTEGQSTVPTVSAIRSKFKAAGWLVVTLIPGKEGADVILGNFDTGIMSLVGQTERFRFDLIKQPPPVVPMDHQRFDVVD